MKDTYIAYDSESLAIVMTAGTFSKHFASCIKRPGVKWINVTHPTARDILRRINETNGTDYGSGRE